MLATVHMYIYMYCIGYYLHLVYTETSPSPVVMEKCSKVADGILNAPQTLQGALLPFRTTLSLRQEEEKRCQINHHVMQTRLVLINV